MKDNELHPPKTMLQIYLHALKKQFMWSTSRLHGHILITEFPKSGGTWLGHMLGDYFSLPFRRNTSNPRFTRSVMNAHKKDNCLYRKPIPLVRDGRDVMVSFYYHHLFPNNWNNHKAVKFHRSLLKFKDYENLNENLPAFIKYIDSVWSKKRNHFTWGEFVDYWINKQGRNEVFTYEALRQEPIDELSKIIVYVGEKCPDRKSLKSIVEKYSFQNMYKRRPGHEVKGDFARKGIVGDWKNHFSDEAIDIFTERYGRQLTLMGYEF